MLLSGIALTQCYFPPVHCVMLISFCRCSGQLFLYLREVRHWPGVEGGRIWTHHPKPGRPFLEDVLEHHRDWSPVCEYAVSASHRHDVPLLSLLTTMTTYTWSRVLHFYLKTGIFSFLYSSIIMHFDSQAIGNRVEFNLFNLVHDLFIPFLPLSSDLTRSITCTLLFSHCLSILSVFSSTVSVPSEPRQYDIHSS